MPPPEQIFWRSGYVDDEGYMCCSCGCGAFTVEEHALRVRVTADGEPFTESGRTVYRCSSCQRAVIPLENFDHLPEAEPPTREEVGEWLATEGGA
jgi:hypothetical protein